MINYSDVEIFKKQLHQLSDEQLKQDYLRGKLTFDFLAKVLAEVESEELILRLVNLGLKLNIIQGILLTKNVKPEFQIKVFSLVLQLNIPLALKIRLLGQTRSPLLLSWFLKGLHHNNQLVNAWSAWAIAQIGQVAESSLLKALKDPQQKVRLWAIWGLGEIGSDRAIRVLILALHHEDSQVRWRAATALGKIKNRLATTKLREILVSDPDHYVRGRAATALGHLGGAAAIIGLKNSLDDREFYVYTNAVYGLETIGDSFAVKVLLEALNHDNSDVRIRVVEVLGRIGGDFMVNKLLNKIHDPDPFVRAKVVETIQSMNTPLAIGGLKIALNDTDIYVRSWAETALKKLDSPSSKTLFKILFDSGINSPHANLPKLWIASRTEVGEYILKQFRGANIRHLISIGSPGSELPEGFDQVPNRLRLEFDDIDTPYYDPEYVLPNLQHILKALHFMKSVRAHQGDLLIHCQTGISRSTAIAFTLYAYRLGIGKETEALNYIAAVQPQAIPNQWIVELADIALKRGGRLIQTLRNYRRSFPNS
ncbi:MULTISPECIES: HEAT repeat domain-containing protein [Planktothrix]|jgi:HEAT repeat protein|uniref:HEAT domain protein repeat-containing protein n=2 Tax=Planktothrix TaxID=54304 RepID=A0A4P6A1U0_PLAAG|nr:MULTISPECIES: HEAT repeat domain-containing protein [Planktothrix]CAD5938991.1 PBS lyase HEAT-like repeat domain protein [Planktothrix rubescens]CAC5341943.1 PBS lyase HEAT-like repeat domain protein [Planktothrix rubescens NIVA-CYA 18]CAD5927799.1 PBS lyase HEAT-like repeat domain protein [Planktothrix rubescens NIVA-CYA 18]CAH2571622.1 PBS lyase HEAT-like repeat domain protein [Planktothrix rubescens]GDZ95007.1 HEAT domain protein repeat-containing protein [Planktothrix agardhii CCAP 1459